MCMRIMDMYFKYELGVGFPEINVGEHNWEKKKDGERYETFIFV